MSFINRAYATASAVLSALLLEVLEQMKRKPPVRCCVGDKG